MYFNNSGICQKHFKTSPLYTRSNSSSTSIKKTLNYDQKVDSNMLFLYFFVALEFHKLIRNIYSFPCNLILIRMGFLKVDSLEGGGSKKI